MSRSTRREWLLRAAGFAVAGLSGLRSGRADDPPAAAVDGLTLSIGTYSFKGRPLDEAIGVIAGLGYDGIEIAVQPGYGAEPETLTPARRTEIRRRLDGEGLTLTALMENLPPAADDARHRENMDRLRRVLDLSRDLRPAAPPLMQTVLGGGTWEEKRNLFRDRLGDWLAVADAAKIVIAIKPHRGGGMSRPEEAVWLIRQLGNPWLRMVYDYSHYAFRDMPLNETLRTALPYTAHVAVKDAVKDPARGGEVGFALPGEAGTVDYLRLLRLLYDGGYRGDVCCEVSSLVSGRPGYDPAAAAAICYRNLAAAFERSGVPRRA